MAQPARTTNDLMEPIRAAVAEVGRRVVGQDVMLERLMVGLLTNGHILLEGVPGLAKTLAVRTLAEIINATFSRIQFTPDLLPADVLGTMVFDVKTQEFGVKKGPIFGNIILADEINRAPAKVQSALLEAMQERQVTIGGNSYKLEDPFLVLATQNPILLRMSTGQPIPVQPRLTPATIIAARREVADVQLDQRLVDYIVDLVRATREPGPLVAYGASPRASIALAQASRAIAYLRGRRFVIPEDVQAVASDVMRHRIVLTFEAEAEDVTADAIVQKVLAAVRAP
jgi:MoxR-like ATPase